MTNVPKPIPGQKGDQVCNSDPCEEHKDFDSCAANSKSTVDIFASKDMHQDFLSSAGNLSKKKMLPTISTQRGDENIQNNNLEINRFNTDGMRHIESDKSTLRIRYKCTAWPENQFVSTNSHLMDAYSRPNFYNAGAMQWLCFRLDMLSSLTIAFSLIFLINLPTGLIDPGIVGLAVTYGFNLNTLQAWVVWSMCNLQNDIISVERILQYISIPEEPPLSMSGDKWPINGEIHLHNLHVNTLIIFPPCKSSSITSMYCGRRGWRIYMCQG